MSHDDEENLDKTSIIPSDTFKMKMEEAEDAPPSLVLLMGPINLIGKQWTLNNPENLMGRSVESAIFVDDRSISRKHAMLRVNGVTVTIEDLGSSNGTVVDGNKLHPANQMVLTDNVQIKAGNVIFKFLEKGNIEAVTNQASYDRSQIDALTQIYNKRAFLEKMEETFKRAKLMEIPLSLIVFDLDKFKNVNDTYGHQAGDFVLKQLSTLVKQQLRPGDFFARFGGEEFTLLLGGTEKSIALDVAERIRATIERFDFRYEGTKLPVTVSLGVSALEKSMEKWEDLFELADKASYQSKQNGRNRVSSF